MEPVRVRVVFEDRHVLSKSQRREGLKRCWVLLRPELDTVAALASHIVHSFGLHDSCPRGLVLSMDQFVLPPFEATDIFKDKDVISIRVRNRGGTLTETVKHSHDAHHIEDSENKDKQSQSLCDNIVVAEEFEKESGGYQSEDEEDSGDQPVEAIFQETPLGGKTGAKRKRDSNRLLTSKRKKTKLARPEGYPTVSPEAVVHIDLENKVNDSVEDGVKQASPYRTQRLADEAHASKANASIQMRTDQITEQRLVEAEESCQRNAAEHSVDGGSKKKMSSRSARRKKAKREWLRGLKTSEKKELIQSYTLENGTQQKSELHHSCDHDNDVEEEVVPVVVKPGHIRFEPLGQSEQPSHKTVETLKWNGTISKKKGQKWGREENFSCRMNDDSIPPERPNAESVIEEGKEDQLAEFEKLFPITRLPKEGDVVAYRVVELSTSWCPELSSFRVGKVTSYDPTSMKIILVQVPDYPVSFRERDEESGLEPDNSLYKEDGSLEIDFRSLHDVRLFNDDNTTMNASTSQREPISTACAASSQKSGSAARENPQKANGTVAQPTENKQCGGWEEICQALDQKKEELSQKNGWACWDRKATTTSTSWSYRALRRSALGPTVSLLRSNKGI